MAKIKQIVHNTYEITLSEPEYEYIRNVYNKFYSKPLDWPSGVQNEVFRLKLWSIFNSFSFIQETQSKDFKPNLTAEPPNIPNPGNIILTKGPTND